MRSVRDVSNPHSKKCSALNRSTSFPHEVHPGNKFLANSSNLRASTGMYGAKTSAFASKERTKDGLVKGKLHTFQKGFPRMMFAWYAAESLLLGEFWIICRAIRTKGFSSSNDQCLIRLPMQANVKIASSTYKRRPKRESNNRPPLQINHQFSTDSHLYPIPFPHMFQTPCRKELFDDELSVFWAVGDPDCYQSARSDGGFHGKAEELICVQILIFLTPGFVVHQTSWRFA